ncbi:MAG: hypothetical protein JXQ25_06070 [Deltaproteobacteria bacterium]|nr:hypothetical protein [Deltaproteobacteria bacterium]
MSLLTDTDVRLILCNEKGWTDKSKLHIYPYEEECLTPIGYDVRVGNQYASAIDAAIFELGSDGKVEIRPGDTVLITTLENIEMPLDRSISAFITSKVSKVSLGLSHISTNIDPDWKGKLLIAMHNPSLETIALNVGESFCTLNFIKNLSPSTKDCGKEPGRTDVLLNKFVSNVKAAREPELRKKKRRNMLISCGQIIMILLSLLVGCYFFQNGSGTIATTAVGIALATSILNPMKKQ